MKAMLEYSYRNSFVNNLSGSAKLVFLICYITAAMISYDTRLLLGMLIISLIAFKMSKIKFKEISFIIYFILIFLAINSVLIFLLAPYQGVEIYGSRSDLFRINSYYTITAEQLFYQFNFIVKYFIVTPVALVFIMGTNPSEFAASLNKIGINYKVSYSVALALRYIPDVQREYIEISLAQQARGIDMSKKTKLITRIKNSSAIIMPLIFSSLEKIEVISAAMELRAFGEKKKRTWYNEKKFTKKDGIVVCIGAILIFIGIYLCYVNGGRFYNPFI